MGASRMPGVLAAARSLLAAGCCALQDRCGANDSCGLCAASRPCQTNADCYDRICSAKTCAEATCSDQVKNGDEADTDCGGSCPACAGGQSCGSDSDCLSRTCDGLVTLFGGDGRCANSSCSNRVRDGDETGVDCGGSCRRCYLGVGSSCSSASDCMATLCCDPATARCQARSFSCGGDEGAWCVVCKSPLGCRRSGEKPRCGPDCPVPGHGCTFPNGNCFSGDDDFACGDREEPCQVCADTGATCLDHLCKLPASADAGANDAGAAKDASANDARANDAGKDAQSKG
ncbi:MAG: hypothetical protein EXR72_17190 [Myxococcales bacterium]|nr:hypothetical protein [Myxococcales bacterium]